jgi:hypothetical protein
MNPTCCLFILALFAVACPRSIVRDCPTVIGCELCSDPRYCNYCDSTRHFQPTPDKDQQCQCE